MTRIVNNCVALVCLCLFWGQSLRAADASHSEQIKWGNESVFNEEHNTLGLFSGVILGLILGSMGGLFMLGMLTKRANSGGAIIGIVASIIVQLFVARFQTFHLLLYTASGFISCFVIGYLTSLFFKKK